MIEHDLNFVFTDGISTVYTPTITVADQRLFRLAYCASQAALNHVESKTAQQLINEDTFDLVRLVQDRLSMYPTIDAQWAYHLFQAYLVSLWTDQAFTRSKAVDPAFKKALESIQAHKTSSLPKTLALERGGIYYVFSVAKQGFIAASVGNGQSLTQVFIQPGWNRFAGNNLQLQVSDWLTQKAMSIANHCGLTAQVIVDAQQQDTMNLVLNEMALTEMQQTICQQQSFVVLQIKPRFGRKLSDKQLGFLARQGVHPLIESGAVLFEYQNGQTFSGTLTEGVISLTVNQAGQ